VADNDKKVGVKYYDKKDSKPKADTEPKSDVHVKYYSKEENEERKPKNPPIVKDEENYWGK
jgi:hypothetical protein